MPTNTVVLSFLDFFLLVWLFFGIGFSLLLFVPFLSFLNLGDFFLSSSVCFLCFFATLDSVLLAALIKSSLNIRARSTSLASSTTIEIQMRQTLNIGFTNQVTWNILGWKIFHYCLRIYRILNEKMTRPFLLLLLKELDFSDKMAHQVQ